jgi:hypothetical protein
LLIALVFFAWGVPRAWDVSAAWWMLAATLTNVVCIVLLMQLFRREGMRYRDLLRIERGRVGRDLLLILGMLIVSIPLAMIPSIGLGTLLFGDANATSELMFRPLPTASAFLLLFLFPITVGLAELPTYFGYVMPRLAVLSGRPWLALSVASSFLAIQHCALPLLFDGRFLAWRLLMFLPFAFFAGLVLKWRPQLMPYMIAVHIFMDFQAAWIVLNLSL